MQTAAGYGIEDTDIQSYGSVATFERVLAHVHPQAVAQDTGTMVDYTVLGASGLAWVAWYNPATGRGWVQQQ